MLKLQSKGGKFDIVLSDASLQGAGNSPQKSVRSLSSAGRRKTKDLKTSNVLSGQKELSPRQQNAVKPKSVKSKDSNLNEDDSHDQHQTNTAASRHAKHAVNQKEVQSNRKQNANANKSRVKAKISATSNQANNLAKAKKTASNAAKNENYNNSAVITQEQLASLMEALKNGNASLLPSVASQGMSKVTAESQGPRVTEPAFVPGLDLGSLGKEPHDEIKTNDSTASRPMYRTTEHETKSIQKTDAQSVGTISVTSRNELQTISYSSTPTQGKQGSYAPQTSSRAEPTAMRSSFAIGAPGQVAYDYNQQKRDKNKQYLADLERQIQLKKTMPLSDKERFIKAMEDPSSQPMTSRHVKNTQSTAATKNEQNSAREHLLGNRLPQDYTRDQEQNKQLDSVREHNTPVIEQNEQNNSFGGRKAKSQYEMDEIERRRIKHLEHQRAVQEQVEEKRRLKMEERERKFREEKEIEERLARERDVLALQYEEEMKRQQAKEEAEIQRQLALQRSVIEAYESAKQEKQNTMLLKLKAGGHDISNLQHDTVDQASRLDSESVDQGTNKLHILKESNEMPQQFSSRSDKGFRPILNLNDDVNEDKKKQANTKQLKKEITKQKVNKSPKSENNSVIEKTRKHSESKIKQNERFNHDVRKHRASIESKKSSRSEPVSERRTKKTNKPISEEKGKEATKDRTKCLNIEKQKKRSKKIKAVDELHQDEVNSKSIQNEVIEQPSIKANDLGYKRSSTVTLHEDDSTNSHHDMDINERKYSQPEYKEEYSNWDSWSIPTSRQQQILEQLRTLRKGLLDKKLEYERGTTPSSSYF